MGRGIRPRGGPALPPERSRSGTKAADLGSRIRDARLRAGLTQEELGAPYSREYVSRVECGRIRPSRAALEQIATKLGESIGDLAPSSPDPLSALGRAIALIKTAQGAHPRGRDAVALQLAASALETALQSLDGPADQAATPLSPRGE
jgi:transcriptional regulator with XRE-family HTH domain